LLAVTVSVDELPALIEVGFALSVTDGFGFWPVKAEHPVKTDRMIIGMQIDGMRLMNREKDSFSKVKLLESFQIAGGTAPAINGPV
jgi:hypothetical protein